VGKQPFKFNFSLIFANDNAKDASLTNLLMITETKRKIVNTEAKLKQLKAKM